MSKKTATVLITSILCFAILITAAADVEWDVTWYHMDDPGIYDLVQPIAHTALPFEFAELWEYGTVLDSTALLKTSRWPNRDDRIGFQARCVFYSDLSGEYSFSLSANNGIRLLIDGKESLRSWNELMPDGTGNRTLSTVVELEAGIHELEIWYYEWDGLAQISFQTTLRPLSFEEVALRLEQALSGTELLVNQLGETEQRIEELELEKTQLKSELDLCSKNQ